MEEESKTDCDEKEFGHFVIQWKISNYIQACYGCEYQVESPVFLVRPHLTEWKMVLRTESGLFCDKCMLFDLERLESDSGPDVVWVNWKVSFISSFGKVISTSIGEHYFSRKYKYALDVPNIFLNRERLYLFVDDELMFRCQMIVHAKQDSARSDPFTDYGLVSLSQDFELLYKQMKYSDIKLKVGDGCVRAHKAILSSRSGALNNVFNLRVHNILNYSHLCYDGMQKILPYLYSGAVEDLFDKPSISLYDCIMALNIDELKKYFLPEKQKIETTIKIHTLPMVWNLNDCSMKDKGYISSSIFGGDAYDITWQLHIYPSGLKDEDEYVSLVAENIGENTFEKTWAQVALLDGVSPKSWETMSSHKELHLKVLALGERESIFKRLKDNRLKICIKLVTTIDVKHSFTPQASSVSFTLYRDSYQKLSKDISSLREDISFIDVILVVGGNEIEAHKCILSARSSVFASLLNDAEEDKFLTLSNIKPHILKILLDYIYSGVLKVVGLDTLLEVYEAAGNFGLFFLIQESSQILLNNLHVETVSEVLMHADAHGDKTLKAAATKFMRLNMKDIQNKKSWKILESERPSLCTEVKEAIEKEKK